MEYNELTKRLLAEGYTAENPPDFVRGFRKYDGGFTYRTSYVDEMTFKTPCGLLCKGRMTMGSMCWYGVEYTPENGRGTIHCPYGKCGCKQRGEPFASKGNGTLARMCPVVVTDEKWQENGSCEEIARATEERIKRKAEEFIEKKHGKACRTHMRFNYEKDEWEMNYSVSNCIHCNTNMCPILGRSIAGEKGNVYYDIEIDMPDETKKGTFFEGERVHSITKGIQVFKKPIPLELAKIYAKTEVDHIRFLAEYNELRKILTSWTVFQARIGKFDLKWKVVNIRAEKKNVRDLDQDLADIEAGITVTHVIDTEKAQKAEKSKRIAEAKEKRKTATERKIINEGWENMTQKEKQKAFKLLDSGEIHRLNAEHKQKEPAPEQLSLFDLI